MLLKLEMIVQNQELQIALLQGAVSGDREEQMIMLEDKLPDPVNSVQQLQQFNTKLEEGLELRNVTHLQTLYNRDTRTGRTEL